jgi:uncharacterized protein YmfQ (DUF2313 family)
VGIISEFDGGLKKLLPPGLAFAALPGSQLDKLMKGLSKEYERISNMAEGLISEANPATMGQMLQVRRDEAGLPDPCRGEPATFQEKRAEVVAKWNLHGGATLKFIQDMCILYGYDVQVVEGTPNSHTFTINYLNTSTKYFRAGKSTCGEHLQLTDGTAVHCLINRIKPAHTLVTYNGVTTKTW